MKPTDFVRASFVVDKYRIIVTHNLQSTLLVFLSFGNNICGVSFAFRDSLSLIVGTSGVLQSLHIPP